MDYKRIYDSIISNAEQYYREGYTERHHIVPKCMGGNDLPENIVDLTAREHLIVHLLLARIYPNEPKIVMAASLLCGRFANKVSARTYENIKKKLSAARKGKKHSEETKRKISENNASRGRPYKPLSEEKKVQKAQATAKYWASEEGKAQKLRASARYQGRKLYEAAKLKKSIAMTGRKFSEETKQKMRTSHAKRLNRV